LRSRSEGDEDTEPSKVNVKWGWGNRGGDRFKTKKKDRNKLKILFGISGENK